MTCYNPVRSRLGFAQNAAVVVGPFVIKPAELIQVTISLVVNDCSCCIIIEAAYVFEEGLNVLGGFFLAALTCAAVRAGTAAAAAAGLAIKVLAILAGLILVWSIRRVVYGKLRRPFCFGSEGGSSKRGHANARGCRKGCEACERQQAHRCKPIKPSARLPRASHLPSRQSSNMGLINCGTSYFPTSTNLSIKGRDYLPWPVLVTLSR